MAWYWQGLIVLAAPVGMAAALIGAAFGLAFAVDWWVSRSDRRLRAEIDAAEREIAADWDRRRAMAHLRDHGWAVTPPDVTITAESVWTAAGVEREWLR